MAKSNSESCEPRKESYYVINLSSKDAEEFNNRVKHLEKDLVLFGLTFKAIASHDNLLYFHSSATTEQLWYFLEIKVDSLLKIPCNN